MSSFSEINFNLLDIKKSLDTMLLMKRVGSESGANNRAVLQHIKSPHN